MRKKLINILESFSYPVFLQGSLLSKDDYPNSFFTFWNFKSENNCYYDNKTFSCDFGYWIYFYSDDTELIEDIISKVEKALKEYFILPNRAIDVKSDIKSHTGKMLTVYYKGDGIDGNIRI